MNHTDNIKDGIIEAALEQFVVNGCKRITMDQVATSIHISKRTLYEEFACKEDLIDACLGCLIAKMDEEMKSQARLTNDPLLLAMVMSQHHDRFCQHYERLIDDTNEYYPDIFKRHFSMKMEDVVRAIQEWLEEARSHGDIRPGADLKIAANALVYFAEQVRRSKTISVENRHSIYKEFAFTYMRGLLSEEAVIRYSKREAEFKVRLEHNTHEHEGHDKKPTYNK